MRSNKRDIRRERAEPTFEAPARDGDFSAREGDRFTPPRRLPNSRSGKPAPAERMEPSFDDDHGGEEVDMTERPPRRRRSTKRQPKRNRRSGMGLIGRLFYWGVVLGIWGLIGIAGVIGYTVATMPQIDDWKVPTRPPNVEIVDASGTMIANRGDTGGEEVSLSEMSPFLPEAVVAIEDRRFYHHFGVDPIGLARAMVTNLFARSVVQGGSTLTQQLAKNLFLQPDRTLERKLQEAVLALWLEWRFSKEQILEMYLNRVYLGAGAYGVDAAARRYFGKSAREVNLAEAATIAGLLKAPSRYAPTNSPKLAAERAKVVLAAMAEQGYVSRDEAARASAVGAPSKPSRNGSAANYVADWVMDLLPGYVARYRTDLVVTTTIDARMQAAAENAIRTTLDKEGVKYKASQGALVAIDNDGAVKALVGGKDYATSQFDRAIEARRQPGSAFKPFVYLTAIEHGFTPDSIVVDEPVSINGWAPKNYENEYLGPVTLTTALARSLNTVAARLTATLGPDNVVQTARRVGIVSQLHDNPSIALGTGEVTPLEITAAYVPFANGGWGIIPYLVEDIRTKDGKVLFHRQGEGTGRVISEVAAGTMNRMLSAVVTNGTGQKAMLSDRPVAGKTGTSQDFRDAWFIGYTNGLTAGVWLGNDDNTPTRKATGGALTALLWNRFMTEATRGLPARPLPGVELVPPPDQRRHQLCRDRRPADAGPPTSGQRTDAAT